MTERPLIYEFPASWREPAGYPPHVTVQRALASLAKYLGGIPESLDDEHAVRVFADACAIPLVDLDIEADVPFPQRRFASRAWVRDQYTAFYLWCLDTGWIETSATAKPGQSADQLRWHEPPLNVADGFSADSDADAADKPEATERPMEVAAT